MASIELIAKSNPRTNITLSINKQQSNRQRICDTEENQSIVFISIRNVLALIILVAPCRSSFSEHLDGTDEFIDQTEKADLRRQLVQYKRQRKPKAVQEPEISEQIADAVYKSKTFKPERRPKPKSSKRRPNQTCGKPPKTCEMDLCTSSKLACIGGSWYCLHTPKKCPAGETCDPLDGKCKDSCGDPPTCETDMCVLNSVSYCANGMDLCTESSLACVEGSWVCEHKPKVCPAGTTYSWPADDDNEKDWQEFRANYPERPFCLLMPNRSDSYSDAIRVDALNDKKFRVHNANWTSDDDPHDADDWFSLCDLDQYGQDMKFIGLYIDGKDYAAGIKICEEYDDAKDWIKLFVGSLSPNVYSCKEHSQWALLVTTIISIQMNNAPLDSTTQSLPQAAEVGLSGCAVKGGKRESGLMLRLGLFALKRAVRGARAAVIEFLGQSCAWIEE
ncbi:hypothetical protein ACHAWO_012665 [Cyclotella atomus]|uniref:Uncharacterized protein n=1 Tax=Cyclotella atomus TaxID=382360 RepID=A0ABD3PMB8_9STRA